MNELFATIMHTLDPSGDSLSRQIVNRIKSLIEAGKLHPGDKIPATRELAMALEVSRGTVVTAIELLVAEGLLEARSGSGTFVTKAATLIFERRDSQIDSTYVAPSPRRLMKPNVDNNNTQCTIDFRPCRPSMELFPVQAWRRCVAKASIVKPQPNYGDPQGDIGFRQEIVNYLRRSRGLNTTVNNIIVTNGSVHAMHILSSLYLDSHSNIIFEEPGYPLARQTFALSGARLIYCGVDREGLKVEDFNDKEDNTRFVYVTPSHQFPTGSRLSLARRHALVDWATRNMAFIIEDDYDGEFRYDVPPLAPMAAMAPEVVIYCGTFSKTLFPGLRIGFAVAPESVIDAMASFRTLTEYTPNTLTQDALKHFIVEGHFERHVHRMRLLYGKKRKRLAAALSTSDMSARLSGLDSGLSALVEIDSPHSAQHLASRAQQLGILVPAIERYCATSDRQRNALVVGYAAPSLIQIERGVKAIASFANQATN